MALVNLLQPGLNTAVIDRDLGLSSDSSIGITPLDTPGDGSELVAAPKNIVCSGLLAYGSAIVNVTEGEDVGWPEYISTLALDMGSLAACTLTLPSQVVAGTKITLAAIAGSVADLTLLTPELQNISTPLASIAEGEFASWQAILVDGEYYWVRVG